MHTHDLFSLETEIGILQTEDKLEHTKSYVELAES